VILSDFLFSVAQKCMVIHTGFVAPGFSPAQPQSAHPKVALRECGHGTVVDELPSLARVALWSLKRSADFEKDRTQAQARANHSRTRCVACCN